MRLWLQPCQAASSAMTAALAIWMAPLNGAGATWAAPADMAGTTFEIVCAIWGAMGRTSPVVPASHPCSALSNATAGSQPPMRSTASMVRLFIWQPGYGQWGRLARGKMQVFWRLMASRCISPPSNMPSLCRGFVCAPPGDIALAALSTPPGLSWRVVRGLCSAGWGVGGVAGVRGARNGGCRCCVVRGRAGGKEGLRGESWAGRRGAGAESSDIEARGAQTAPPLLWQRGCGSGLPITKREQGAEPAVERDIRY